MKMSTSAGPGAAWLRVLLPLRNVLSRWIDLFDGGYLPALFHELDDHIGELLNAKLEPLVRNQLLIRRAGRKDVQIAARLYRYLILESVWRLVGPGEVRRKRGIKRRRASNKRYFAFVKRHRRFVDVSLRIGCKIHRPLALLLVVWSIEPVIVKM